LGGGEPAPSRHRDGRGGPPPAFLASIRTLANANVAVSARSAMMI
jgi:hypothetical protein